uniref:Chemokine interleukin-8-like domain-containing protein n=2 Tax=Nothobranchius kuhntae TaxID=321403 RepID=A0A1A8JE80_NOTKU
MSAITPVIFLVFLIIHEASSVADQGMNLRCRCISKEKKPIGRNIRLDMIEVNLPNSHCKDLEIIAIHKNNRQKICLDPDARWVRRMLDKWLEQRHGRTHPDHK